MELNRQKEQIEEMLKVLLGKPLWAIGRAGEIEWFHFGSPQTIQTFDKKEKTVGEYAIHVQCAWRILGPDGILVGSQDMYYPAGDLANEMEDFEWDRAGANRCDEKISFLLRKWVLSPVIVKEVRTGVCGYFSMLFTGEYLLEVFPDNSLEDEYWRLFQPGKEEIDFVVSGQYGGKVTNNGDL